MKKVTTDKIILYSATTIGSFIFSWFVLDSLLLALGFTILCDIVLMYILKYKHKNDIFLKNINNMYNFINLMNIQMLCSNSVYESYKNIENYVDVEFGNMSNEDLCGQLQEIATLYNLKCFKLYVNNLVLFESDGGNYKKIQEIATSICQKTKIYYNSLFARKGIKLFELSTLYLLFYLVMIFLKISIYEYYSIMVSNVLYQVVIFSILVFSVIFYGLAVLEYFKNNIKGL